MRMRDPGSPQAQGAREVAEAVVTAALSALAVALVEWAVERCKARSAGKHADGK